MKTLNKPKKYYRISELINDYMELQREFKKYKVDQLKTIVFILTCIQKGEFDESGLDRLITGLRDELEDIR